MGDFVSNVGKLLDETIARQYNSGIQQGIQQGKYEAKIEFAKKLIKKGSNDEEIAELTEIEIEKVKELRESTLN